MPEAEPTPQLLAVFGSSAAARRSLDHLVTLALGLRASVHLVVAGGEARGGRPGWTPATMAAYARERLRRAEIEATVESVHRPSAAALARLARSATLVLVARETEHDRFPEQLMAAVGAPVLVVPEGPGRSSPAYRVLLAIRSGFDVLPDVEVVARLAEAVEVEALVVHVPEIRGSAYAFRLESEADRAVDAAVDQLQALGLKAEGTTLGPSLEPEATLRYLADDWDATLVVLNSRRARGPLGGLLRSTARDMIRKGTRPVLLTRA